MEFLSFKQCKAFLSDLKKSNLDKQIHHVACSGLYMYQEQGDTEILSGLVKRMPKSSRGNALRYWITQNANVKWDSKAFRGTGGYVKDKPKKVKGVPQIVSLAQAIANPFYDKPDTEASVFKGYSRETEIINFVKRLKAKEEKLKELSEADQEKVKLDVSDETMSVVLGLIDLEGVTKEPTNAELAAKLEEQLAS